jgi:hypothetical protein
MTSPTNAMRLCSILIVFVLCCVAAAVFVRTRNIFDEDSKVREDFLIDTHRVYSGYRRKHPFKKKTIGKGNIRKANVSVSGGKGGIAGGFGLGSFNKNTTSNFGRPTDVQIAAPVPAPVSSCPVTTDGRCGPDFGHKKCPNGQCCSIFGWCGNLPSDSCGKYKRRDNYYHGSQ